LPTIAVDEATKKYLESLKKKLPTEEIPPMRELMSSIVAFIREKEDEFISRYNELKPK
jgi:hypothetical protein